MWTFHLFLSYFCEIISSPWNSYISCAFLWAEIHVFMGRNDTVFYMKIKQVNKICWPEHRIFVSNNIFVFCLNIHMRFSGRSGTIISISKSFIEVFTYYCDVVHVPFQILWIGLSKYSRYWMNTFWDANKSSIEFGRNFSV